MRPPKHIRVGYRNWRIKCAELRDRYGECDKEAGLILYSPGQSPDVRLNTIIHEILHACFESGHVVDSDDEEKTVTILANQLSDVLSSNPDLLQWINVMVNGPYFDGSPREGPVQSRKL